MPEPRKRALLIGLTQYRWSDAYAQPLNLRGGANDAQALAAVLQTSFGFAAEDIRLLLSEPATPGERLGSGANIRQGLEWLIAQTAPGDVAVVYYSGHGAQWPDPHGDEIDGYDESIVPCDARDPQDTSPPQGDLIDDELHDYITQLAARTDNLTVIFDCCHSASGTRANSDGADFTARQADFNVPLKTGDLAPAAITATQTALRNATATAPPAARRNAIDDSNPNYVFLAACRAGELAYEFTVGADDALWPEERAATQQRRGLFTYFLLRALRHGPTATYQDILTFLGEQVSTRKTVQHPQGEGPLARQLFGGSTRPVDWLPVTNLDATGLTLGAGSARGLAPGAVVQVYPAPGALPEVALGQEAPIGAATVTRVYPLTADATFEVPPPACTAQARALVIRPVYPAGPLRVALRASGADAGTIRAVEQVIAARPILQLVDPATPDPDAVATVSATGIRFTVYAPASDGHPFPALAPLALAEDESSDTLHSALRVPPSALAEPAANRLAMLAAYRAGLDRANPDSALGGVVRLRLRLPDGAAPPAGELRFRPYTPFNVVFDYPQGAGNDPLYINLLRFGADGSISLLYPPPGSEERLAPGQQFPPRGEEDYFTLKAVPPPAIPGLPPGPARERLKLFISTGPLDLRGLVQPPIPTTLTRAAEAARGLALPDLPDAAESDWTSVTVSYLILP